MAENITRYFIFVASPSDLRTERVDLRTFVEMYNRIEAKPDRMFFDLVMWEDIPARADRPQSLANRKLRSCDYFIMMLWKKWGSPTHSAGVPGPDSGTREEYDLALSCLDDKEKAMSDIAIFFKQDSETANCTDGEYGKVKEFRKEIHASKRFLTKEFSDTDQLKNLVWENLAEWRRTHGESVKPSKRTVLDYQTEVDG